MFTEFLNCFVFSAGVTVFFCRQLGDEFFEFVAGVPTCGSGVGFVISHPFRISVMWFTVNKRVG